MSMSSLMLREAVPLAHALVGRVAADVDVRVLFIKGPTAVAQGLRGPRQSSDTDVLVDPSRLELLRERLTSLGWVDEHPYSTPTAADYSRTHRHPAWPCELDLHITFPGLYADPRGVFEQLWARRVTIPLVGQEIMCPDLGAHALVLALNSLRDPHRAGSAAQLADLVDRVSATFDEAAIGDLGALAGELGAADTAAPFLAAVRAPNPGLGSTDPGDLRAWRLRTQPAWRVATWIDGLRAQPLRSLPRYLWRAAVLDEVEIRVADPNLPPGRWAVFQVRARRIRRGVTATPAAWGSLRRQRVARFREIEHTGDTDPEKQDREPHRASVGSGGPAPPLAIRVIGTLDRMLPLKRGVVVRTAPDFEDQGLAMCEQLVGGGRKVVWLTAEDDADRLRRVAPQLSDHVRVVSARSMRGVWAYLLAEIVIHTHGLYQMPQRSRRKCFINLWHGMPVKKLDHVPAVAARQTDILTVTSDLHARHIAETWRLDAAKIHVTGLPRNDRMLRTVGQPRSEVMMRRAGDRPLVVWLPTYRHSVTGEIRSDGTGFGNPFELPGANVETVADLATDLGVHLIVKLHPMSPRRAVGEHGNLSVWEESALDEHDLTLYELLGHADLLVTDHSSVWVDYLLLDRPIVFSIADLDSYADGRGHYFAPLEEHLPGPLVTDLESLGTTLGQVLNDHETAARWAAVRARLRPVHHRWLDDGSAERVAALFS